MIKEDFIQFVWQYGLFDQSHLKTLQNEGVKIFKPGELNLNQGPDFLNSKIQIGDVTWAGNIEIHLKTSDFYKHKHHSDPAFQNLILHVVYENDIAVGQLPLLELKNRISDKIINGFSQLKQNKQLIPCSDYIGNIEDSVVKTWLQRLFIQRLENKCNKINQELIYSQFNWENLFWQMLFKYMGGTVNKEVFEQLAKHIDFNLAIKNCDKQNFVEALFFGTAGMLSTDIDDIYYINLRNEYFYIKNAYKINQLNLHLWKYMRMRPVSFPDIRIAQLAVLLKNRPRFFSDILEIKNVKELRKLFLIEIPSYWQNRFRFGVESHILEKKLGNDQVDVILINVIVPLLFFYGRINNNYEYEDQAIKIMEELHSEKNKITRMYSQFGIKSINAAESQSLLELYLNYCKQKRCLSCNLGNKVLRNLVN
jgi:hypothetical protein